MSAYVSQPIPLTSRARRCGATGVELFHVVQCTLRCIFTSRGAQRCGTVRCGGADIDLECHLFI